MNKHRKTLFLALILGAFSSSVVIAKPMSWFEDDPLAHELSQLTKTEAAYMEKSDIIEFHPVVLPKEEFVIQNNDYFDWPIATMVEDTIVVLFSRRLHHWGGAQDYPRNNRASGIRMITTSQDGGKSWSRPIDVISQAGRWDHTVFGAWGGGLGVHDGIVYLALNEGLYRSEDKGASWGLVGNPPDFHRLPAEIIPTEMLDDEGSGEVLTTFWSPGMRITFHEEKGLVIWTTRGFKPAGRKHSNAKDYGKYLCAIYSPDYGKNWFFEEQPLPGDLGLYLNEITPLEFRGGVAFIFRNGGYRSYKGYAISRSGWFPLQFGLTNIGPVDIPDTPDLIFNPLTNRLEVAVTFRHHFTDKPMELRLYSVDPNQLGEKSSQWRHEGILLKYKDKFGSGGSDGMNPVGGVVDRRCGVHRIYVWGGDGIGKSGIFELNRSLKTNEVHEFLSVHGRVPHSQKPETQENHESE